MKSAISSKNLLLGTLAFIAASFAVQAVSHFSINAAHYDGISFMRSEPIMSLGILTMVLQGLILTYLYQFFPRTSNPMMNGLMYAWLMGIFLGSYIALVEPSKYAAPSVVEWMAVEGLASLVQFSLFGILIGFIFNPKTPVHEF